MKMSKNMVRVISIIMVVLMVVMITTPVFAYTAGGMDLPTGSTSQVAGTQINKVADDIITILKYVGAAIAVVVLLIMGIKYLMASVEEKADFKKAMIPYVVGALLVFAAPWIAGFIIDLVSGIGKTLG